MSFIPFCISTSLSEPAHAPAEPLHGQSGTHPGGEGCRLPPVVDIMREGHFSFDRVLVMDRFPLTGLGLCALVDEVADRACSEHLSTLTALRQACRRYEGERLLLITELISDTEPLSEGIALLKEMAPRVLSGQCGVMVFTDLHDPLLLKVIVSEMPSVVVLRSESLSVLREAIGHAGNAGPEILLSPAVSEGLALAQNHKLTPRELEWLVTQADGMGLKASAKAMKVSYKTVSAWRYNISRHTGSWGKGAMNRRLAQIRRSVTGGA
ncbi:DNA-binding response regulator [Salmonella enterica subsp. enterica serovar Newport]|nr:DNA-binding response regulator [Salmonella enterica subsp. enterica serovar Newport]MJR82332.1 DNA-binding response regulator [Salmonella enterica subsp. enterica serovar Newport]HAE2415111.1 response regulator transcription factor [Salmonella enterica subsp. enterica serovar Newport]